MASIAVFLSPTSLWRVLSPLVVFGSLRSPLLPLSYLSPLSSSSLAYRIEKSLSRGEMRWWRDSEIEKRWGDSVTAILNKNEVAALQWAWAVVRWRCDGELEQRWWESWRGDRETEKDRGFVCFSIWMKMRVLFV